jgi:hypothetical protein
MLEMHTGVDEAEAQSTGSGWSGRQPPQVMARPDECDTLAPDSPVRHSRQERLLMQDNAKRR